MGHRDDFYIVANIIGITGPVNELPSVYFQNAAGEFGHITQVHKKNYNWGRTMVRTDPGWVITNQCPDSCGCGKATSHEINGEGRCFHKSRGAFVPRADISAADLDVVAEAIHRCPFQKSDPRYRQARDAQEVQYATLWDERHAPSPSGRRGAIDYTGEGLANNVLKMLYPDRA